MKDVSQYPVKWGFMITKPKPWSKARPHLGVDRPTPKRTPIIVNGQLIGFTGDTGGVDPHHHLQRVRDGLVINPKNDGFILPSPVTVIDAGEPHGGENPAIGRHIRLCDGHGEEWSHFHLDEINVTVGQTIGGDIPMDEGTVHNLYLSGWQRRATKAELKEWVGKPMQEFFYAGGKNQYEWLWQEVRKRDEQIKSLQADPAVLKIAQGIADVLKKK